MRLVAQNHQIGFRGHLAVGRGASAELLHERRGSARARVRAEHRIAPTSRHRPGHVPGTDQTYLHTTKSTGGERSARRSKLRLVEESLLDQPCALLSGHLDV